MTPTSFGHLPSPPISRPPQEAGEEAPALEAHLEDVATRARRIIPEQAQTPSGHDFSELVATLGWLHDLGKANPAFQARVRDLSSPAIPDHHSPLGSLVAYHVLRSRGADPAERLAGFLAVARHHGQLPDAKDYILRGVQAKSGPVQDSRFFDDVVKQTEAIDAYASDLVSRLVKETSGAETSWSAFKQVLQDQVIHEQIVSDTSTGVGPLNLSGSGHDLPPNLYGLMVQAWSGLVLADKTSAAQAPPGVLESSTTDGQKVLRRIEALESQPADSTAARIHELRKQARRSVIGRVEQLNWDQPEVASLTLPTGLGKTLAGLEAAHRIRDAKPGGRTIVYALPYTSIIDQVADEVRGIYGADPADPRITVHHHLSDASVQVDTEGDEPTDERAGLERMLGTSWRSGLVVTTFVQLFESLASPGNTQSMKLPSLHDAVVILDEPQALPHRWWALAARLIDLLTDQYRATVVAMTATPPRIMEAFGQEPKRLVTDAGSFFDPLNRVAFHVDESAQRFLQDRSGPLSHQEAAKRIEEGLTSTGSRLVICNTKASARALTAALADQLGAVVRTEPVDADLIGKDPSPSGEDLAAELVDRARRRDGVPVAMHLTTRIRPVDRLRRVKAAKLLAGEEIPFVLVSTQLVEAGVDVSFEEVRRDLAPVPSLVQAAGRCNRSMSDDTGAVHLWWLDAPNQGTTPAEAVYARTGNNLLSSSAAALSKVLQEATPPLSEPVVAKRAVDLYYDDLHDKKPGSRELAELVDEAQAEKLGRESMIEERQTVEILVLRRPAEVRALEKLREAWAAGDHGRARTLLREARERQVSIPVYDPDGSRAETLTQLPRAHPDADLRVLDVTQDRFRSYLDHRTGEVQIPDSSTEARIL